MEQKRTLGDEANGHEDSGSGIYQQLSLSHRTRKKKNGREQKTIKSHPVVSPMRQQTHRKDQGNKCRCALIRPISIPEAFVIKPKPPIKCYRTGKVWKCPPKALKRGGPMDLVKSCSDSDLLDPKSSTSPNRRHSNWELDGNELHSSFNSDSPLHSPSTFSPVWRNLTDCSLCSYCLADINLIVRSNLQVSNSVNNFLYDFLPSNSFQHIILWQ